ncbi:hypothetical protein [Microseira wollei]|uniref:hypothetical protein n=1 Tax=Microseira wollei TaxID=467598 RepID=UPI001CFD8408|nr:hypothetical protein [Microseira wollei]
MPLPPITGNRPNTILSAGQTLCLFPLSLNEKIRFLLVNYTLTASTEQRRQPNQADLYSQTPSLSDL